VKIPIVEEGDPYEMLLKSYSKLIKDYTLAVEALRYCARERVTLRKSVARETLLKLGEIKK